MKKLFFLFVFLSSFTSFSSEQFFNLSKVCLDSLSALPGDFDSTILKKACMKSSYLAGCYSEEEKKVIYHYQKTGTSPVGKKILVYSLFHGDEIPAGSVARRWIERLEGIDSRNTWRIIPIVNPDGLKKKTRTNGRGVDLNRNLPTKNWDSLALKFWKDKESKKERRFPGQKSASEQETKCVMNHLESFKPDFIVSVHTPYGVLDFDGPGKSHGPRFHNLPWKSLGHYPGSLGRYMWAERNVPVLTIELKGNDFNLDPKYINELQDVAGSMAIRVSKSSK